MDATLKLYSAEEIRAALDTLRLVEALRVAFRRGATAPVRHAHVVNEAEQARLLLMPAWREGRELGVKLVTVFPGNAARGAATVGSLYVLMDGATGHPVAVIDGEELTLRRTGAASALASTYLSRKDSRTLLVVGTGRLAPYMAASHCAVRPIARVMVWGRNPAKADALAERMRADGYEAEAASDLAAAVGEADIVTCATTAREPLIRGEWVRDGCHVDLVGAFTPDMRESDDALIARAEVFVDTFAGALKEAGDLLQPMERGVISQESIRAELADLASGRHCGRTGDAAVTVFKSVGAAVEDLSAAALVVSGVNAGGDRAIPG